jgi:hypothetical protein
MQNVPIGTASDMEKLSPNERADVVKASIVRDHSTLDAEYRERLERRGREIASRLRLDG